MCGAKDSRLVEADFCEQESLVDSLATAVGRVAAAFAPRPVVYRASDFRTNEFRNLQGGDKYEPEEHNPMIGYRGCYRYVSNPDLFDLELRALARVREQNPNLHLMIPFVRTKWELEKCLELVDASPLGRQRGLHRWVMAEVPSVVHWLPQYIGLGIDGVSIGSNDLTQLMLGETVSNIKEDRTDLDLLFGCLLMLAMAVMIGTLLGDLVQAAMDPRQREETR